MIALPNIKILGFQNHMLKKYLYIFLWSHIKPASSYNTKWPMIYYASHNKVGNNQPIIIIITVLAFIESKLFDQSNCCCNFLRYITGTNFFTLTNLYRLLCLYRNKELLLTDWGDYILVRYRIFLSGVSQTPSIFSIFRKKLNWHKGMCWQSGKTIVFYYIHRTRTSQNEFAFCRCIWIV